MTSEQPAGSHAWPGGLPALALWPGKFELQARKSLGVDLAVELAAEIADGYCPREGLQAKKITARRPRSAGRRLVELVGVCWKMSLDDGILAEKAQRGCWPRK